MTVLANPVFPTYQLIPQGGTYVATFQLDKFIAIERQLVVTAYNGDYSNATQLVANRHYSVRPIDANNDIGYLVNITADQFVKVKQTLEGAELVALTRSIPIEQPFHWTNADPFNPQLFEALMDRWTMILQDRQAAKYPRGFLFIKLPGFFEVGTTESYFAIRDTNVVPPGDNWMEVW